MSTHVDSSRRLRPERSLAKRRSRRDGPRLSPGMARILVIVAMLAAWELGARFLGDPLFVAPPSQVAVALVGLLGVKGVMIAIGMAIMELVVAFTVAVILGIAIGIAVGLNRFWRGTLYPIIVTIYAVPQSTILPLFVLLFGIGAATKIAFGITHSIFAVVLTLIAGIQNIDPVLLKCARAMGADRRQILVSVILPSLVPTIFTGMRLAMAGVLLGVLLAELYVSSAGVGLYTQTFANSMQPAKLFALVTLLAAAAVILNELCRVAEARFTRWHN
jgi:ABC-type nitrate/sulfonate/bicarbonate transport system permease component